ncbi:hypothetical protein VTK73DRAFT_6020 [Phialemonium thermophilum]|uniref:Uncharacterized protein n=1 Tax=Phialemonium thermophilum TaxID=223376 RepID=A0ABR3V1R1_9PEZI
MTPSSPAAVLRNGLRILLPLSLALTLYLYLYPVFQTCAFPLPVADGGGVNTGLAAFWQTARSHLPWRPAGADLPGPTVANGSADAASSPDEADATRPRRPALAPFRLLAFGDPQLEGDTSIPNAHGPYLPHLSAIRAHLTLRTDHPSLRHRVRQILHDAVDLLFDDVPNTVESFRKRLDLFGNDFYLAHIYRTLRWWTRPTHVAVLGDLVGSQWLTDDEFDRRSWRYWNRVFRGGERVPDDVAHLPDGNYVVTGSLEGGGAAAAQTSGRGA